MIKSKNLLIIGSGLAGSNLAKQVRRLNAKMLIQLVCADAGEGYSKLMLSNAL